MNLKPHPTPSVQPFVGIAMLLLASHSFAQKQDPLPPKPAVPQLIKPEAKSPPPPAAPPKQAGPMPAPAPHIPPSPSNMTQPEALRARHQAKLVDKPLETGGFNLPNGMNWRCDTLGTESVCYASSLTRLPSLSLCKELAAKVGKIGSYGTDAASLSNAEIQQCNESARRPAPSPAPMAASPPPAPSMSPKPPPAANPGLPPLPSVLPSGARIAATGNAPRQFTTQALVFQGAGSAAAPEPPVAPPAIQRVATMALVFTGLPGSAPPPPAAPPPAVAPAPAVRNIVTPALIFQAN